MQQRHNYPDYQEHKKLHDSFIDRLNVMKNEIAAEGVALHNVLETNNILLKWLINHISVVDKKLGNLYKTSEVGTLEVLYKATDTSYLQSSRHRQSF